LARDLVPTRFSFVPAFGANHFSSPQRNAGFGANQNLDAPSNYVDGTIWRVIWCQPDFHCAILWMAPIHFCGWHHLAFDGTIWHFLWMAPIHWQVGWVA